MAKAKKYTAGRGAQYNDDQAQALGRVMESLGPNVEPQALVDAARPPSSPVHVMFEWDDSAAAERYRVWQARSHINHLVITVKKTPIRAYHSVVITTKKEKERVRGYAPAGTVASSVDLRQQVEDEAWMGLLRWRRKYREIKSLTEIFEVIDRIQEDRADSA